MQSIRPRSGGPSDELREHIRLDPNAELAVGEGEVRLLHHILGLGHAAEHPVGDCERDRPQLDNLNRGVLGGLGGHGSFGSSAFRVPDSCAPICDKDHRSSVTSADCFAS